MLTEPSLNKLTTSVVDRIREEVKLHNQKVSESYTEEDLLEQFYKTVGGKDTHINAAWNILCQYYPPVFTELLNVLRLELSDNKTIICPLAYELVGIILAEVERLTINVEEFDCDTLLVEQLFEKIYPMLIGAKVIYFKSEKFEPTFELTQSVEEVIESDTEVINEFNPPYPSSGNEHNYLEDNFDEGDWE